MSRDEVTAIEENTFCLRELIDPKKHNLIQLLLRARAITSKHMDKISGKKDKIEKNDELMRIMKGRSFANFKAFQNCLRETMQSNIVLILKKSLFKITFFTLFHFISSNPDPSRLISPFSIQSYFIPSRFISSCHILSHRIYFQVSVSRPLSFVLFIYRIAKCHTDKLRLSDNDTTVLTINMLMMIITSM